MATRRHTRSGIAVSSLSAGGGKRGAAANTWAALAADTDSESETETAMDATVAAFHAAAAAFMAVTPVKKAAVPRAAPGAPARPRPRRTPMTDSDPVVGPPRTVLARQLAEAGERHSPLMDGDPLLEALHRGDSPWGDILYDAAAAAATYDGAPLVFATIPITPPLSSRTEDDLWSQPWAARLSEYFADHYDTRALTDAEWEAMLSWLYASGWEVQDYDRDGVKAYADDMPPRIWVRPPPEDDAPASATRGLHGKFRGITETDAHHHDCACDCDHDHAPAVPLKTLEGRKATIPRFCRAGAECADLECRFVHADTIPRINEPCKFGAECGATDPTGLKRSQCLRMHPGETWTAEMVIVRPPPPPAAATAAAGAGKEETTA